MDKELKKDSTEINLDETSENLDSSSTEIDEEDTLSNRTFYTRNRSFVGDFKKWFLNCVNEKDLFRVWFKNGDADDECLFLYMVNVIEIPGDYLIGFESYDSAESKDHTIDWHRLSEIDFALITNEEDL